MTTTPIGDPVSGARASRNPGVVTRDQFASRAESSIAGGVGGGVTQSPKLVDGVLPQVDVVRGLLEEDVPVHGVLCSVEADWPLIGGAFSTQDVQALWPKRLFPQLQAEGPLTAGTVAEIHRKLAPHALPPA